MMRQSASSGKVLAALAVLEGESDPTTLLRFGPPESESELLRYAELLKRRFSRGKGRDVAEMLRGWTERSPALPIHEIHPGWILEAIRNESPRVIGLVCRYLPGSHVRYIIEHLPNDVRHRLPTISESFAIPAELVASVKEYLSRKFFRDLQPTPDQPFSCRHIPWMSAKDLRRVIRELGYVEIRRAFANVDAKIIRTFLTRFPLSEAKAVRHRIEYGPIVSEQERKKAQQHIIAVDLHVRHASDLPYEIGLTVLADCAAADGANWIEGVIVRLEPEEGYKLRRYAQEARVSQREGEAERRQAELLELIRNLADRSVIARYWQQSSEEETTQSQIKK